MCLFYTGSVKIKAKRSKGSSVSLKIAQMSSLISKESYHFLKFETLSTKIISNDLGELNGTV